MKTVFYDNIPKASVQIRKEVFENEQGFVDEFDEIDGLCRHAVFFIDGEPIGTLRFYEQKDKTYLLGRVAIKREYRGKNYGARMLYDAEEYIKSIGGEKIILHAQLGSKVFYEKQGFIPSDKIDYEQDCPHIWMSKDLKL